LFVFWIFFAKNPISTPVRLKDSRKNAPKVYSSQYTKLLNFELGRLICPYIKGHIAIKESGQNHIFKLNQMRTLIDRSSGTKSPIPVPAPDKRPSGAGCTRFFLSSCESICLFVTHPPYYDFSESMMNVILPRKNSGETGKVIWQTLTPSGAI